MNNCIPRVFEFQGFQTIDVQEWLSKKLIKIILQPNQEMRCCRCRSKLRNYESSYQLQVRHLDVFEHLVLLIFDRRKGYCPECKKVRSEYIEFISDNSPHVTKAFTWFTSRLCEIASVVNIAKFLRIDKMLAYRIDYHILQRLLMRYKIPKVTRISVDEVYARKKKKEGETRDDLFLTIITDLDRHKVIYVSQSRRKEALDRFFKLLGADACSDIKVVACDQHEGYRSSVLEYCKNATVVWDRFHLVQNFNVALNEARKSLFSKNLPDDIKKNLQGKYRFIFLKRNKTRTAEEADHVKALMEANQEFLLLELIKEKFAAFFDSLCENEAKECWEELGIMIYKLFDHSLLKWYRELDREFKQVLNYFKYRVTSAVSEGINNVIKMLKRRAFGYKNMEYFGLKIMQKCGYLNSNYISNNYDALLQI